MTDSLIVSSLDDLDDLDDLDERTIPRLEEAVKAPYSGKDDPTAVGDLSLALTMQSFQGIISRKQIEKFRRVYFDELSRLCAADPSSNTAADPSSNAAADPSSNAAATLTADLVDSSNDPSRSLTTLRESQSHPSTTSSRSSAYRTEYPLTAYNVASDGCPLTYPSNPPEDMSGLHRSVFEHVVESINDAIVSHNENYPLHPLNINPQWTVRRMTSRYVHYQKDANTELLPYVYVLGDPGLSMAFKGNAAFETALAQRILLQNNSILQETKRALSECLDKKISAFLDPTLHGPRFSAYVSSLKDSETDIKSYFQERLTASLNDLIENGDNSGAPISVRNLRLFGPDISVNDAGRVELTMSIKTQNTAGTYQWRITDDWRHEF